MLCLKIYISQITHPSILDSLTSQSDTTNPSKPSSVFSLDESISKLLLCPQTSAFLLTGRSSSSNWHSRNCLWLAMEKSASLHNVPVVDPVIWFLLADERCDGEGRLTRAHDTSCAGAHSVLERPQVQLMHSDIPNVLGNLV